MGFFDKIKAGLTKTRTALSDTLGSVFSGFSEIDDDFYDELEECLILADLGVETATKATQAANQPSTGRSMGMSSVATTPPTIDHSLPPAMMEVRSVTLEVITVVTAKAGASKMV